MTSLLDLSSLDCPHGAFAKLTQVVFRWETLGHMYIATGLQTCRHWFVIILVTTHNSHPNPSICVTRLISIPLLNGGISKKYKVGAISSNCQVHHQRYSSKT